MTADRERRLRADALRNRGQILAAAKKVFGDQGPDVPMEEIARQAGVGTGTLYRRFPDREALIRAVAHDSFAHVLTEAQAAAAEEPSAWDALVRLLRTSRELQLSVQLAILSPVAWSIIKDDPEAVQFRRELLATLDGVVRAAQEEGTLRQDVGAGDVAALLTLLLRPMPTTPDAPAWMVSERAMALMLDGLRSRSDSPLPGQALGVDSFNSPPSPGN
ncbi:TetR/AcrR family transcriptional regulator [Streptomyces sp. NPDC088725]|uniref:TetR/AcrR family transcriptional regulator n=1 Tax=Streptomyces sp. NPDC088725 TaxID=3365873 RepID=UPI003817C990